MQVTREEHQRRSGANMFINGGLVNNNHENGGEKVRMKRLSKFTIPVLIAATAAVIMFFSAAPFAAGQEQGGLLRAGNGPGPAANESGPGCNIVPPVASIGTKVSIKQFPPADSLTDPELAGPVTLLKSGKFDLPIEKFTKLNVPPGHAQRNNHAAPLQGCGEDSYRSEAHVVHHPRCRRQRRSGAPRRELLEETA